MRTTALLILGLTFFPLGIAFSANEKPAPQRELPENFPAARYEKMLAKSPFAPATAVVAVAATPSFAANLYVAGIAKIGNDNLVTIRSRDQQTTFSILAGEDGRDGMKITGVDWTDQIGKSKVTIKKGDETAVLEFDQAMIQKAVVMPGVQPMAQPGGAPKWRGRIPQPGGGNMTVPLTETVQPMPQVNPPDASGAPIIPPGNSGPIRTRTRIIRGGNER